MKCKFARSLDKEHTIFKCHRYYVEFNYIAREYKGHPDYIPYDDFACIGTHQYCEGYEKRKNNECRKFIDFC